MQCVSFPQVGSQAVAASGGGGGVQSLLSKLKAGARAEERGQDNPGLQTNKQEAKFRRHSVALGEKNNFTDINNKKGLSAGVAGAFGKGTNLTDENDKLSPGLGNKQANIVRLGLKPGPTALSSLPGRSPKQQTSLTTSEKLLQDQVLSAILYIFKFIVNTGLLRYYHSRLLNTNICTLFR